jgi:glycosyltransferase involved in cell wall biosynthesis
MTDSAPLISVVTIFLNTEKYIEEAIESIFAQTYIHWELLLVDDGSSDRSSEIALGYAQQHPGKVRYLEHAGHQNRGMSASRNLGVRHAQGEIIAFLDSDDIWRPQKLEQQIAILQAQPEAAMVCGPNLLWYSWTGNPADRVRDSIHFLGTGVKPNCLYQPPALATLVWRNQARTPGTCSVLIRRQAYEKVGGFEESFRGMYEDRVFFNKIYLHFPVYAIDECFDQYRMHPDSCCAIANQKYNPFRTDRTYLLFLDWMTQYLDQHSIQDKELRQAFRRVKLIHKNSSLLILMRVTNRIKSYLSLVSRLISSVVPMEKNSS